MKISDTPFLKTIPYFTNSSLFMGKIWTTSFFLGGYFENQPSPPTMEHVNLSRSLLNSSFTFSTKK